MIGTFSRHMFDDFVEYKHFTIRMHPFKFGINELSYCVTCLLANQGRTLGLVPCLDTLMQCP